jgi:hypothetical protein
MKSFPRCVRILGGLAVLLLAGCFETKQEFTLNPDGSGKVVHESTFQEVDFGSQGATPERALKKAVAGILEHAKGVEAWQDVSYQRLEDGRIHFKGTAYFKNLAEFDMPNQTMLHFNWQVGPDGKGGVLTLRQTKEDSAKAKKSAAASLTPEERAKKLREDRTKFQQSKPMFAGIFGSMRHEAVFHLPGKASGPSAFETGADGSQRLVFDGNRMLEVMEKLIMDDTWMAEHGDREGQLPEADEMMGRLMFGAKGPVRVTVPAVGPAAFDYAAAVTAASATLPALQAELGARAATPPPAQGEAMKAVRIVGARFITEKDDARELQPFNGPVGLTLAVVLEMPGSILSTNSDESGLDTAVADDGADLMPEESDRQFSFPRISSDQSAVMLEIPLKLPAASARGLKELSGHLNYTVSAGTKEIDLGLRSLKAGSEGTKLDARLEELSVDGDTTELQLHLEMEPSGLKALYLVNGDRKTELKSSGYNSSGGSTSFRFTSSQPVPPKGHLVAEVHDQLHSFTAPFKLENITFLGAPLQGSLEAK